MFIKEIGYTKHINKRIEERCENIKEIFIQDDFFKEDDNKQLIYEFVKTKIQNELKKRLIYLRDTDFSEKEAFIYKILLPVLKRDGKTYRVDLLTESEDGKGLIKKYYGDLYIVIVSSNVGITIMNIDSSVSDLNLKSKLVSYVKQGYFTEIKSFYPLEFIIDYSESESKIKNIEQKIKKTDLGEISLKKYNDLMSFDVKNEKNTHFLIDKQAEIDEFIKINSKRISNYEIRNLEKKKESIQKRIEQILSSSQRAMEKLQKKADYRKGAKFKHDKFGKGTIQKVEKFSDGVYDVIIDFPEVGIKKLRLATKQKPAETSAGLSESVTRIIRALIRQQQGL